MELVKQEKCGDCGPACVAMVLGCSLNEAKEYLRHEDGQGVTSGQIIGCLAGRGVPAIESLEWPTTKIPAILTVPSLNNPGLLHYIVYDGRQILDPSNEAKHYPDDMPGLGDYDGALQLPWTTAILLWPREA